MKRRFWLFFSLFYLLLLSCNNSVTPTATLPIRTLSNQETVTFTPTPTLTDTPLLASVYEKTPCFSGTSAEYQLVNTIDRGIIVMVLGKNSNVGEWLLVRQKNFTPDCWVERIKLVLDFDLAVLQVVSTPLPPTLTSTPTHISIFFTPTKTPKDNDQGNSGGPAQTAQVLTAQAAQAQTAQALTAQAAQVQTAQALTAQAAQVQTAQALTAQALACELSAPKLSGNRNGQNVRLSWNFVSGATKYEVLRSVNGGEFNIIGTTADTLMNDTIPNRTTHIYIVVAINSCGTRKASNEVTLTR